MLKAITWCAKCLLLYVLVVVAAIRFSWIFTTPVWQVATKMHWTQLSRVAFVLSYFLPIFAAAGFVFGLIPFGKLGKALTDLYHSLFSSARARNGREPDQAPPILWAWVPVTFAFLIRFATWQSRNSSVFDAHRSTGRAERFFGHALCADIRPSRRQVDRRSISVHRAHALPHGRCNRRGDTLPHHRSAQNRSGR